MKRRDVLRLGSLATGGMLAGCLKGQLGRSAGEGKTESTPCPMPEFDASKSDRYPRVEPFEKAIFERMNQSRHKIGIEKLEFDRVLSYIARLHSRDMGRGRYFSHQNDEGMSPQERIASFGYECEAEYSENLSLIIIQKGGIGVEQAIKRSSSEVINGWKTSDEHRQAMWSESVEVAGVGCYITAENDLYVTCDFCSHDPADASDAATGTPPAEGCYYGGDRP